MVVLKLDEDKKEKAPQWVKMWYTDFRSSHQQMMWHCRLVDQDENFVHIIDEDEASDERHFLLNKKNIQCIQLYSDVS